MSGKFIVPIQLPQLDAKPDTNPAEGYYKVYLREGKLKKLNHLGVEEDVEGDIPETDPIFSSSAAAGITTTNIAQWNQSFAWGNHGTAGYLTEVEFNNTAAAGITTTNINNWNSAFSWGNHSGAGYLLQGAFNDSPAGGITTTNINNWNSAYGWGNHAAADYITASAAAATYVSLTGTYSNPSWITALAWSKITGVPTFITGIASSDVTTALGYTPASNARTLTINGFTYDLTADRSWTVGDLLSSGSYANPSWITALAWSKITGAPAFLTAETDTLSSVTGRGATTATTLVYTGTGEAIRPNTDSIGVLGASNFRWATVYSRGLSAGANTLDLAGPAINLNDASGNIKLKLFSSTGNVVIQNGGTFTDAGYRLDVNGTTRLNGFTTVTGGTLSVTGGDIATNYSIQLGNHSSGRYIGFGGWTNYIGGDSSGNYLVFNSNSSERMRVTSTGNVGIGTTSPTVRLTVIDPGNTVAAFIGGGAASPGGLGIGTVNSGARPFIQSYTAGAAATTDLTINPSGGNVGIGTTSPTSKLHVAGGRIEIDNGFNLESRTTPGNALTNLIGMSTNAINVGVWEGNYMADLFLKGGNGSVFADFSQGNNKYFAVRGVASATPTEYMRVNHLGNVLIGTTTDAGYRLNVNGTARVTTNLLVDGSIGIGIATPSARYHQYQTQGIMARYDISSPNANQNRGVWDFYTNVATAADFFGRFGFKFEGGVSDSFKQFQLHIGDSVTPKLVVDGAGRVGIGTIVPGAKLHVFGTDELLKFGDGTSGNNAFMSFNDRGYVGFNGSAGLNFIANSTRPIVFGTGSTFATYTEWARFATGTGNLLINTNTDAGYKLDVNGTARVQSQLQVDGNVTVTNVVQAFAVTADVVTADSIAKSGGTDSQFLKADGSVDETSYATSDLSIAYAIALG